MILNSLKLIFYSFFNKVYADSYIPHWATAPESTNNNTPVECADVCKGKEGLVLHNGKACVCAPHNTGQAGSEGWKADTDNILDVLLLSMQFVSNIGTMVCIMSLVWGAIQLAISDGQQQKKTKAQDRIKISLIGLALFGSLNVILSLVVSFFK